MTINLQVWQHTAADERAIKAHLPAVVEWNMVPGWYYVDPRHGQPVGPCDTEECADIIERASSAAYARGIVI